MDEHIRSVDCPKVENIYADKMRPAAYGKIKQRTHGKRDELCYSMFAILFPGRRRPNSPYADDQESVMHLVNMFVRLGPELIRVLIRNLEHTGVSAVDLPQPTQTVLEEALDIFIHMHQRRTSNLDSPAISPPLFHEIDSDHFFEELASGAFARQSQRRLAPEDDYARTNYTTVYTGPAVPQTVYVPSNHTSTSDFEVVPDSRTSISSGSPAGPSKAATPDQGQTVDYAWTEVGHHSHSPPAGPYTESVNEFDADGNQIHSKADDALDFAELGDSWAREFADFPSRKLP